MDHWVDGWAMGIIGGIVWGWALRGWYMAPVQRGLPWKDARRLLEALDLYQGTTREIHKGVRLLATQIADIETAGGSNIRINLPQDTINTIYDLERHLDAILPEKSEDA
ncbi:MAG: hypothetical protein AAFQ22_07085 [Pseudomonadota bacterium]